MSACTDPCISAWACVYLLTWSQCGSVGGSSTQFLTNCTSFSRSVPLICDAMDRGLTSSSATRSWVPLWEPFLETQWVKSLHCLNNIHNRCASLLVPVIWDSMDGGSTISDTCATAVLPYRSPLFKDWLSGISILPL